MNTCANCTHSSISLIGQQADGSLMCRQRPPTPFAILVPKAEGLAVQSLTLWPQVNKDDHCDFHQPTLKMVS